MSFLAPLFLAGLAAVAIPILVHLIQRERKTIVEFPSLMFISRIPYQSVERRRIHNWLLLCLRVAALALIVAAFARPFLRVDPVQAAAGLSGAREVVILLDRSASMGYGDAFARAQQEAQRVIGGLSGDDRATLVLFGTGAEETVRATGDRGRLESAVRDAVVTSDATRYAPALRLAQSLLGRSSLPRREAVIISDFQRSGWERQEEITMPEGAVLTPISVGSLETSNLAVTSVRLQRTTFENQERVMVTAGLVNRGPRDVTAQPVRLEIEGRLVETRPVTIGPNAAGSVTFPAVTVAAPMQATIRAGSDDLPADNDFHLMLSPSRAVSVLVVPAEGEAGSSNYLTTALSIGTAPPFATDVVFPSRVTPASFERRSVVIINNGTRLSTEAEAALERFVTAGGGLFIVLGEHTPWQGESPPLLPGTLGQPVDRLRAGGATLGFIDHAHPIFEQFKDPRTGNFAAVRFYKYRSIAPDATDRALARFDDGAAAIVERIVGSGRVIALASTVDQSWNDFATRPMFLPLIHETVRYLGQYQEPEAWYTVGRMLDVSVPVAAMVREGSAGEVRISADPSGVVMAPSGRQTTFGEGGIRAVELTEQGFYSVRLQGVGERRPFNVAVNLDPAESDLTPMAAAEFAATATGQAAVTASGQSLEHPELTSEDLEKKQSIWWYLFAIGAGLLLAEAVLANRLSKRLGFALS